MLVAGPAVAQVTGDYRSRQTGTWGQASTWERYSGTAWVNATSAPTVSDQTITVRNGHTVTNTSDRQIDQLVVAAGATLVANKKLLIQNGAGTDLRVVGTLTMTDNVEHLNASTSVLEAGSTLTIQGGSLIFKSSSSGDLYGTVQVTAGKLSIVNNTTVRVHAGAVIDNSATVENKDNAVLRLDGTLINRNVFDVGGGSFVVEDDGVVEHARNGGNLPKVDRTTWDPGSTLRVTGITNTLPDELTDTYHHVVWNNPGQTAALRLDGKPVAINGDLTVASTGSGSLAWVNDDNNKPLTVGGDYVQTGGTFVFVTGNSSTTMTVAGDFTVSGGTFIGNQGGNVPTVDLKGDVSVTGAGTFTNGAGSALDVTLTGTTSQTFTGSGTIGDVDIFVTIDNASGVVAASDLDLPDDVTVVSGTLDMAGYSLRVGDDLTVTGDLVNVGRLTLDGTTNQQYDYPALLSLPRLVVDKPSGDVTLVDADLEITEGITTVAGDLDLGGHPVALKSVAGRTATVYTPGGAVTGDANLSVERAYGDGDDGWRMIAVPLTGISYSDLNGTFHTQGAGWSVTSVGIPNLQRLSVAVQDWDELDGADAAFEPGTGYIFYMWEERPNGSPQLPAVWTITGPRSTVTTAPLGFNTTASDSNNLVGNPRVENLDWDATVAASTDVGTTYATWDPSVTAGGGMSGYRYYNSAGGTGAAGPFIPPFQAFSVQATASGATLAFTSSAAANDGDPVVFGRRAERRPAPHVRLHLEGGAGDALLGEAETYLVFDGGARPARDDFDVDRLDPISETYATLWFEAEGSDRLAFDGRSMADGHETFALRLAATEAGTYTVSWPDWHDVPDTWRLTLYDDATGREVDLRAAPSTTVRLDAGGLDAPAARFTLHVVDPDRAQAAPPRPSGVRLAPASPNPVRDAATVRFALPDAGRVRLAVFDALGRRVAVLAEGEHEAGWHTVRWSAAGLPSGAYVLRLVAGGEAQTALAVVAR